MRVMIVEDNALISFMMEDALTEARYEVVGPFTNAADAIFACARQSPELALVDIDLEGEMNGIALARHILERWGVPSMFVTGQTEVARNDGKGALGVVIKPFGPSQIVAGVAAARARIDGAVVLAVPSGVEFF